MTIYRSAQGFVAVKRTVYVPSLKLPCMAMLGTPPKQPGD